MNLIYPKVTQETNRESARALNPVLDRFEKLFKDLNALLPSN